MRKWLSENASDMQTVMSAACSMEVSVLVMRFKTTFRILQVSDSPLVLYPRPR